MYSRKTINNILKEHKVGGEITIKYYRSGKVGSTKLILMEGKCRNVPGILEFAATMSKSIQKQLSGELPSTNNGNGMGMGKGRMPNFDGGQRPEQQRPDGNVARPALEGAGRQPGGIMPPEGVDMAAMEALRQEVMQAGGLTGELREKARKSGIPDNMIEMLAGGRGGMMPGGMRAGEGAGGNNRPNTMVTRQNQPVDKTTLTISLVSGIVITAGIIMVLFFKRRRYVKV